MLLAGQGIFDDRRQIAGSVADRTASSRAGAEGGAFGGKEDMSNPGQTALAGSADAARHEVQLTRDEIVPAASKRMPSGCT
jgi:hypothetical protein